MSTIALVGNISEGFTAYGPYRDFDEAAAAHTGPDVWLMELESAESADNVPAWFWEVHAWITSEIDNGKTTLWSATLHVEADDEAEAERRALRWVENNIPEYDERAKPTAFARASGTSFDNPRGLERVVVR